MTGDDDAPTVTLTFLGSGDAFGSGGRLQTCLMVDATTTRFLIDCGASSLVAMKAHGVDPLSIDAVLLTHLHGDHFGGLPFLVLDARFSGRTRPLVVAGPPSLEDRITAAMDVLFPGMTSMSLGFEVRYVELESRHTTQIGDVAVTPFGAKHYSGAPSYSLRVECRGRSLGYSGDTEWTDNLPLASADTDVFVCEAYEYERNTKFHLSYHTLLERQKELGTRRLIATHLGPQTIAHLDELELETAHDGKVVKL